MQFHGVYGLRFLYCFADFGIKTGERDDELGTLIARFMYRDDNMITVILFFFLQIHSAEEFY